MRIERCHPDHRKMSAILAPTFVAVDIDGSLTGKAEFLASIKAPAHPQKPSMKKSAPNSTAIALSSLASFASEKRRRAKPLL